VAAGKGLLWKPISVAPERCGAWFYCTAAGAEMDLVLDFANGQRWAIEVINMAELAAIINSAGFIEKLNKYGKIIQDIQSI
jgi:hypothetical protein